LSSIFKKSDFDFGVPMKNLPKLICMNSKIYDMMLLRFQIKSKLKDEIRHESIKFVSYMLQYMLRDTFHNTELPLVHNVTVTPKYFKQFSFIDIEAHYSLEGKSRTDQIIATIMKTKEVLEKKIDLKLYADVAEELRGIFNTKPMERGTRVARKIARGMLKFGFTHAYSATQVLNNYEKKYVNMVLDNIDYSSLLIVIQGEFSHHFGDYSDPTVYELREMFNKNFMKKFDFGEDNPNQRSLSSSLVHFERRR